MKTETIIKQLIDKGFVYPSCLQWTPADINLRLRAIGREDDLKTMSDTDKRMLLDDFFTEYEDVIIEFINDQLEEHLDNLTDFNPADKPF